MRKFLTALVLAVMALAGSGLANASSPAVAEKPSGVKVIADDTLAAPNTPGAAVEYAASLATR